MIRQAISPRLAIRIRLNMPRLGLRESGALGFAAQQAKCQQAVHGARTAKVNLVAAPPMARQPDARTARSAANQPRPMPAPMAILLPCRWRQRREWQARPASGSEYPG